MLTDKYSKTYTAVSFIMAMTCWASFAIATDTMDHSKMDHSMMDHSQQNAEQQPLHKAMMNQQAYSRKEVNYQLPDVMLTDQHGNKVSTATLLNGEDPVMLNFIFTSCNTICPILSATFAHAQKQYSTELTGVKMVSISIDPENDTSAKLQDYAQRFHAQPGWTILTGDLDNVMALLDSFNAYRGEKMNHLPLTFIRRPGKLRWLRLEGFANASDLIKEYQDFKPGLSVNISQQ